MPTGHSTEDTADEPENDDVADKFRHPLWLRPLSDESGIFADLVSYPNNMRDILCVSHAWLYHDTVFYM